MLKTTLYGSWLLGLFPFTFDSRRKQLRRSRCLQFYGLIGNFFLLGLFYINQFVSQEKRDPESFKHNPLLGQIHKHFKVITTFVAIVTHLRNFWGSIKVQEIANELLNLTNQHFYNLNLKNCPNFNCCVIQKFLAAFIHMFVLFVFALLEGNSLSKLFALLGILPLVTLQLIIMHFHIEILFIYRYVLLINGELLDLAANIRVNLTTKSSRIRELTSLYNRLLKLNKKVLEAYDFQLTLILTMHLAYNIFITFFLIVSGISMNFQREFLVAAPQIVLNVWDFWLNVHVCDITEKAGEKTLTILRRFTDLQHKDVELERSVSIYNQFLFN